MLKLSQFNSDIAIPNLMKIARFYIAKKLTLKQVLPLPTTLHRHAINVLRLKQEDELILFNGEGGEYLCRLIQVEKRRSSVLIQQFNSVNRESSLKITLCPSLIKPDKMDFCIQKNVELGVTSIQPLITDRTIVRIRSTQLAKKIQRWQGIIIAACEQSGRTVIPNIYAPLSLDQYLSKTKPSKCLMMLPEAKTKLSQASLTEDIALLVGPEGGFTPRETQLCLDAQVEAIQFGSRILRAETAAMAGVSLLQAFSGNL
jgi:16S rRNA (uracil1498-N3)-methyltransferase